MRVKWGVSKNHFARVQNYENRLFSAENSTEIPAMQARTSLLWWADYQPCFRSKQTLFQFNLLLQLDIFEEAFARISDHIVHWGYQETRQDYIEVLKAADVAVSTAEHEFFGVSM